MKTWVETEKKPVVQLPERRKRRRGQRREAEVRAEGPRRTFRMTSVCRQVEEASEGCEVALFLGLLVLELELVKPSSSSSQGSVPL